MSHQGGKGNKFVEKFEKKSLEAVTLSNCLYQVPQVPPPQEILLHLYGGHAPGLGHFPRLTEKKN